MAPPARVVVGALGAGGAVHPGRVEVDLSAGALDGGAQVSGDTELFVRGVDEVAVAVLGALVIAATVILPRSRSSA